jgi:uncharacterized alpha-E superfamily protein
MISRVADHCFWFGRYLDRAESTARVLATTAGLALDTELSTKQCWQPVIIVAGEEANFVAAHGEDGASDSEVVQAYMTWTDENLTSIRRSVAAARENARSIREVVSLEAWETVNELHLWLGSAAAHAEFINHRWGFYRTVRERAQLCLGLLRSTMLHDTPLDFIWLGVMLERSGQTARILDVHHHALANLATHQVVETSLWLALLRACSGFEPFMKLLRTRVSGASISEFLIFEGRFPRSVRYCVHDAYQKLASIRPPADHTLPGGRPLERLRVLDDWLSTRTTRETQSVHDTLTHVVDELHLTADEIARDLLATS